MEYFELNDNKYLVIANQQDDMGVYNQKVVVYMWDQMSQLFAPVQDILTTNVQSIQTYISPTGISKSILLWL